MEFLNLSLAEFFIAFGAITAFSVALYLLDRTRRRLVVSTLRFWVTPGQPAPVSRNKKVNQPLSLFLQLLGMLLLLLAIAEFQFGGTLGKRRDHVLVLDSSAWMAASAGRTNASGQPTTLMDIVRANALGWLRAVPAADRVLVVRADGLATPVTSWESDRRKVARAILESQPGATALNLSQNLEFARELQRQSGATAGEIVYSGPGRISAREANALSLPNIPAFRVLNVDDAALGSLDNSGLRSVGARRSETDPGTWDILVRVRNYSKRARTASVTLNFGKAPMGMHPLELPPDGEKETVFKVRTRAAGILETRLYPKDSLAADNYAALELPEQRTLHVIAYTDNPEQMRPALSADPRVNAEFRTKQQYTPQNDGLIILDRFHPAEVPQGNVLWIDPPSDKPPVPIRERVEHPEGLRWVPDQPLTTGLRARNTQIEGASVFDPGPNSLRIAEIDKGPVVVARVADDRKSRMVVIGFNPFAGSMRYELTTPLLLANILRWMEPGVFRDVDVATQSAGAVSAPVSGTFDRASAQVLTDAGRVLPFNVRDRAVEFFVGEAARARVIAGNTERVFSLTLPEMWDAKWTPPSDARKGIPPWTENLHRAHTLWPWLALAGATLLFLDWYFFGSWNVSRLHVVRSHLERAA